MSIRPIRPIRLATTGAAPSGEGRLKTVLAAGVAQRAQLALRGRAGVGGVADVGVNSVPCPVPPPDFVAQLPDDIVSYILSMVKGMTCHQIADLCRTCTSFRAVCQQDAFWQWESQRRGYDRPLRLNPFRLNPAPDGPIGGSWESHYHWWCNRTHTKETLEDAVRDLDRHGLDTGTPHVHQMYGHISDWDVSNVTNMSTVFRNAMLNGDLSNWDVSNVTNMSGMFQGSRFNNNSLSGWDVSNVTNIEYMFSDSLFNGDLSGWANKLCKVANMDGMFQRSRFDNNSLSEWNVSNVTNMNRMFLNAIFTGDLSRWNVSNVNNMSDMFQGAVRFNGDLSNWDVSSVTNMSDMFQRAVRFAGDLSRWNVSNVTEMTTMFAFATSFNGDLSNWDVSNVTDMNGMFHGATSYAPAPGRGLGARAGM